MGNVAQTYSTLGRHSEALAMFESVLELRRRVLPAGHHDIGQSLFFGVLPYMLFADCDGMGCDLTCRYGHEQCRPNVLYAGNVLGSA